MHVERDEQLEVGGFGGGVRLVQLRQRPAVARADVEGETVDSHGFGIVDILLPLRKSLAVGQADLLELVESGSWGSTRRDGVPCSERKPDATWCLMDHRSKKKDIQERRTE